MKKSSFFKKVVISAMIFFAGAVLLSTAAKAQTASQPEMLITWKASGSYVPPSYKDKALPNAISNITASLMVISGGKPIDLSGQAIYWYENDTQIGGANGALGVKSVSFSPFGGAPNFITLEAEVPNYQGGLLIHSIQIPVVQPKAVIEAGHPQSNFSANPLTLQGTPYFFSVSDPSLLSYAWSVNGTSPAVAENPQTLDLSVGNSPSGSTFDTSLTITDPSERVSAVDSTNLNYIRQL